jgi:nucleoside-diphosphate-sugar epimerase
MGRRLHTFAKRARIRGLIVGCGYVGKRLAERLANHWDLHAIVRSESSARNMPGLALTPIDLDVCELPPELVRAARNAMVLYLVPPPGQGVSDSRLERFLGSLGSAVPAMILYMSTTGVYGDCGGSLVNEQSPTRPGNDAARRRVAAEDCVAQFCDANRCRSVVFRVPGIYGPGRLPIARLTRGEPIIRPQDAPPGNRIHVDDLVSACVAAAQQPVSGTFNISDGNHASSTAFIEATASLAGLPPPQQIPVAEARGQISPGMLSFLCESRRVDNRRMLEELNFPLRYADYRIGIRASLSEATTPVDKQ